MERKIIFFLLGEIKFDGRVQKEIKTLQENGYEVELIVSKFENDDYKNYDFKIYNLNRKRKEGGKIYNLFTIFKVNIKAGLLIRKIKPNIIHSNDLSALLGGVIGKTGKNQILIYDAHELYPESMEGFKRKLWQVIETLLIKFPDKYILPEENRLKYFQEKYQIKKPLYLVENFPLKRNNLKKDYFQGKFGIEINKKKLLYLGLISNGRGIEEVIEAVKDLDIVLFCIGNGREEYLKTLKKELIKKQLEKKVIILPPIPQIEVLDAINSSDIGFVFYKNTNLNNYYCASNKLFEFINCDKSVVSNNYPGIVKVINEAGIGEIIEDVKPKFIKESLIKILTQTKKNTNKNYYWEDQENELLDAYK